MFLLLQQLQWKEYLFNKKDFIKVKLILDLLKDFNYKLFPQRSNLGWHSSVG